jgi:hypothetical protein
MASLIPSYEYDVFISYRQKDNKHDGWVTEFVDNLKGELESTFKEEISVYFDINPHDGLLEMHDVDASLKEKLKCLVFIPVISRTYCDPKSFAWESEFKAFVKLAMHDQLGLKVKLPGGNIANRVLPVRIHELDNADTKLCESVLGGAMRGIEFIYKEPGVNRPLAPEDDENKNLNNTRYRNQINKVANAIKDIILGLSTESIDQETEKIQPKELLPEAVKEERKKAKNKLRGSFRYKLLYGIIIVLVLRAVVLLFQNKHGLYKNESEEVLEKAISYYDFMQTWNNYSGKVHLITISKSTDSYSEEIIEIQTRERYYKDIVIEPEGEKIKGVQNGECYVETSNKKYFGEEQLKELGSKCEDIRFMQEHHYLHFGALMELKVSGLRLEKKVGSIKFQGSDCLTLTFRSDTNTVNRDYYEGMDINIYLDPLNYSMKGYKVTGKMNLYAICSGIIIVNGIKMPLCKTYFSNVDNSFVMVDLFNNVKE